MKKFNTKILVIDDDEAIRDSFREILTPSKNLIVSEEKINKAESKLFGTKENAADKKYKRSSATFEFIFDEAHNGKAGFAKVKRSIETDSPYAVIFVDMRMPGWSGLETVRHLRELDKRAEIVFVTAYSDHSIEEIVNSVGANISYHCKPFASEEIEQIATKAVYEWNKTRNLEDLISNISKLRVGPGEMKPLLNNILQQVSSLLGSDSALIAVREKGRFRKIFATGVLLDDDMALHYLQSLPEEAFVNHKFVYQVPGMVYFNVEKFGVMAIFRMSSEFNNERIYIVRLFLEQAAMAIKNVHLEEELIKKEKLSAVGQATSMIAHDMKNVIGGMELGMELLEPELKDSAEALNILEMIRTSFGDCMALVNDILDFAGKREIVKRKIELSQIFDELVLKSGAYLKPLGIKLETSFERDILFDADRNKIYRVLFNLVKNSAEALQQSETDSPIIRFSASKKDGSLIICESDNGPGIPDSVKNTLFEAFVTAKTGGTGLGLAIVKQFVEAHGGRIKVLSPEKGAAFEISLPLRT